MDVIAQQAEIAALVTQYVDLWATMHPHQAINAGLHSLDGHVADWRDAQVAHYLAEIQTIIARLDVALAAMPVPLANDGALPWRDPLRAASWEARLVLASARAERYRWEVWQPQRTSPLTYLAQLDVSPYIKRQYAPLPQRVDALIQHVAGIPEVLANARRQLEGPLSRLVVEQSIAMYEGLARFHDHELPAVVQRTHDPDRLAAFALVNRLAVAAYQEFINFLRIQLVHAHDDLALGPTLLSGLVAANEGIDVPLERLLAVGLADLEQNHAHMMEIAGSLGMTPGTAMQALGRSHPPADRLLEATRHILDDIRRFLIEQDIVGIPGDLHCIVQETPPFMRTGSAFMDAPGPLEASATEAYFYLTLPDAAWSPQARESWLAKQSIPGLTNTAIHEAWPGHYLQYLHLAQTPSLAARLFTCTSFTEGWAHYAEQMMVEVGYHADDPRYALQQVSMALLRDCRLIVALRLHTEDIAITEAADFIAREAFFSPIRARQEAIRGARDPGYLNYTLGKLLLLRLRDDLRHAHPAWSPRHLHDALLGCGSPPIPLLREALFGHQDGALLP